jgi:hypothetical protein
MLAFPVHPHRHSLQFSSHSLSLVDPGHGIVNKLINNGLCALFLIHYCSSFAHQEGAGLIHHL